MAGRLPGNREPSLQHVARASSLKESLVGLLRSGLKLERILARGSFQNRSSLHLASPPSRARSSSNCACTGSLFVDGQNSLPQTPSPHEGSARQRAAQTWTKRSPCGHGSKSKSYPQ